MLISNSRIAKGDVAAFKLVNGDEIVARIAEINDNDYLLERPCTVIPSQQGLGLVQSMFTADPKNNININKQHVMMCAPVIEQMVNHYIQTTTGIQPVTKGGIIT
jgi:hypothetical protein